MWDSKKFSFNHCVRCTRRLKGRQWILKDELQNLWLISRSYKGNIKNGQRS